MKGSQLRLQLADALYQCRHILASLGFTGVKGRAFQSDSGRGGEAKLPFCVKEAVQHPQEPLERKALRLFPKALLILGGHIQQRGGVLLHRLHGH